MTATCSEAKALKLITALQLVTRPRSGSSSDDVDTVRKLLAARLTRHPEDIATEAVGRLAETQQWFPTMFELVTALDEAAQRREPKPAALPPPEHRDVTGEPAWRLPPIDYRTRVECERMYADLKANPGNYACAGVLAKLSEGIRERRDQQDKREQRNAA